MSDADPRHRDICALASSPSYFSEIWLPPPADELRCTELAFASCTSSPRSHSGTQVARREAGSGGGWAGWHQETGQEKLQICTFDMAERTVTQTERKKKHTDSTQMDFQGWRGFYEKNPNKKQARISYPSAMLKTVGVFDRIHASGCRSQVMHGENPRTYLCFSSFTDK